MTDLSKTPATLTPGDPWTFLVEPPELFLHDDGEPVKVGDHVSKLLDTSEPLVFRVMAVHPTGIETVVVGYHIPTPAEVTP